MKFPKPSFISKPNFNSSSKKCSFCLFPFSVSDLVIGKNGKLFCKDCKSAMEKEGIPV
jgi:hypothetical protein